MMLHSSNFSDRITAYRAYVYAAYRRLEFASESSEVNLLTLLSIKSPFEKETTGVYTELKEFT